MGKKKIKRTPEQKRMLWLKQNEKMMENQKKRKEFNPNDKFGQYDSNEEYYYHLTMKKGYKGIRNGKGLVTNKVLDEKSISHFNKSKVGYLYVVDSDDKFIWNTTSVEMMDNDLRYIDGSKYYVFGIKKSLCDGYVIENDETPEFYEKYYKCIKIGSDVIKNEDLVFMGEFTTDEQIYFSVKPHLTRMEKDKKYFKNKIKSLLILKYKNIDKVLGKLISSEDSYVELTPGWLLFYKRQICVIEKLFDSLCKETSDEIRRMWSSMNKEYFQVDGVLG